jgi:antitoxin VapB
MSLNIKSEEAHRLVRELAALTGESQTAAVIESVRERLERLRSDVKRPLAERLLAIGVDCSSRLSGASRTVDHAELLYGPDGLPK